MNKMDKHNNDKIVKLTFKIIKLWYYFYEFSPTYKYYRKITDDIHILVQDDEVNLYHSIRRN